MRTLVDCRDCIHHVVDSECRTCFVHGFVLNIECGYCECFERKNMNTKEIIKEAYKVLQAAWVKLYNVESGDIVKVLRTPAHVNELGSQTRTAVVEEHMVGSEYLIDWVAPDRIIIKGLSWPFFCLELVKKAEPVIEIDVKINGVTRKLSDVSQETLLNIRNES